MENDAVLTSVCPIFNFQISQVLRGQISTEEAKNYFANLRLQFKNGIKLDRPFFAIKGTYNR